MHRNKTKARLSAGLILLAACVVGSVAVQAAENPARPGNVSGVPAKHSQRRKHTDAKVRKAKAVKAKPKRPAAKAQASADSAKEITQLKQQLARQQQQIEQLLHAVNQLQAEVATVPKPAMAASAAQPSSDNEVASLAPILPPQPKAHPGGTFKKDQQLERQMRFDEAAQRRNPNFSGSPEAGGVAGLAPIAPAMRSAERVAGSPLAGSSPVTSAPALGQAGNGRGVPDSPLQFHIGSAYVTPVGFMDFTSVWANHDAGSGIGTNFAGIPYGNVFQNNLSEFRMSMQNSRVGFRVDAKLHDAHVIGYMEADFLGNNPGNVEVSSNSNTLRSRLYWLDVRKSNWEILGGQTWSLLTPGRSGISPLPGDIFFTQNIDVNYQLGLFWGRIPEFRVVYHPSKKAAFAFAIDSPEQYVGGSAGGGLVTFPSALAATYASELNTGGNTFGVPNRAPDFIAKLALDPSSKLHFEVGGIERNFKIWNPASSATYSAAGGGGFANLNFELFKGFRLLTNNFISDGGGRYIFGQAPDLIAHADGSISLIHADSTVTGFEATHKNTLVFGYYGGLYVGRNSAVDTTGKLVGYGYSGAPSGQNRAIQEGTFGFNQTIWKDAKWGAINFMGQYSYLTRNPWSVVAGQPSNASLNMVFFNLRYTLPGSAPAMK